MGRALDPQNFRIGSLGDSQAVAPRVAWNGTNFLVVWQDFRLQTNSYDIRAARASGTGTLLDPSGITIAATTAVEAEPDVAGKENSDDVWLVVWRRTNDIYTSQVAASGAVLNPGGRVVVQAPGAQEHPVIVWNFDVWFIAAWQDNRNGAYDIYSEYLVEDGSGAPAPARAIATAPNDQILPAVSQYPGATLVVWEDYRSGTNNPDIFAARVSSDVAPANGFAIAVGGTGSAPLRWLRRPSRAPSSHGPTIEPGRRTSTALDSIPPP